MTRTCFLTLTQVQRAPGLHEKFREFQPKSCLGPAPGLWKMCGLTPTWLLSLMGQRNFWRDYVNEITGGRTLIWWVQT